MNVVQFKGTHCLLFVALDALVAKPGSACDCLIVLSQLFVFANDTKLFVAPVYIPYSVVNIFSVTAICICQ